MAEKVEVDVVRRVFAEGSKGACIEVGPWADSPQTCLELRTPDKESQEYYGLFNMSMSPEFAEALGKVLIAAAAEMRGTR